MSSSTKATRQEQTALEKAPSARSMSSSTKATQKGAFGESAILLCVFDKKYVVFDEGDFFQTPCEGE